MTMKRRVVYMDDETWGSLLTMAKAHQTTVSDLLRRANWNWTVPFEVKPGDDRRAVPGDLSERPVTAVPKPASAAKTRRRR
jgi:hypothetical protein